MNRRSFLKQTTGFLIVAVLLKGEAGAVLADPIGITVYKDPTCGCCKLWIEHLRANSFNVTAHETDDMAAIKLKFAVPEALQSCHTATIGGYVIEGHVPAQDIRRLLDIRPKAVGLAVPGMPNGSPGMESDAPDDQYDVMLFAESGKPEIFRRY